MVSWVFSYLQTHQIVYTKYVLCFHTSIIYQSIKLIFLLKYIPHPKLLFVSDMVWPMWRNGIREEIRECFGGTWMFWKDIPCSSFFFSFFLKKEEKWLVFRGPVQNMHKYIRTGLKIIVLTMVYKGSGGGWGLSATTVEFSVFQRSICHCTSIVKHGSLHSGSRARAAISTPSPAHSSTP